MQFRGPPMLGEPPMRFAWVWPDADAIEVVDLAEAQVTPRAAALARLLERAALASKHASSLRGFVVHREALSGLTGAIRSWPVDFDEVVAGRVPVVVLPGQIGPVADLYRRALDSLRLRTSSLEREEGVVRFTFGAPRGELVVRVAGTCPLVGDPPRPPTGVELGERGSATMDVDWTANEVLGRRRGRLRFDIYTGDVALLARRVRRQRQRAQARDATSH